MARKGSLSPYICNNASAKYQPSCILLDSIYLVIALGLHTYLSLFLDNYFQKYIF